MNLRFWQAYDKTLSTLIDEFADEVAANLPDRDRPPDQRVLRPAGNNARYARAPDGTEALLASDLDRPAWLAVYGPDGRLRSQRELADVLPLRKLAIAAPTLASGLSFSPDGRWLYFVALDLDPTYQASRLYRYDVDAGTLEVVHRDLRGAGGSLSPDGGRYVFARADGDHHDLAELDIATGAVRVIAREPHGALRRQPARLARRERGSSRRASTASASASSLLDARDGRLLATLPTGDDPVHDASWVDDRRVVFLAGAQRRRRLPGVRLRPRQRAHRRRLTNAPFLAFQPSAAGGRTLRFLNREGWDWTLDEVPLPRARAPPPVATAPQPGPSTIRRRGRRPRPRGARAAPSPSAAPRPRPPRPPRPRRATNVIPPVRLRHAGEPDRPPLHSRSCTGRRSPPPAAPASFLGGVLSGGDRLDVHRWALAGYYQFVRRRPMAADRSPTRTASSRR